MGMQLPNLWQIHVTAKPTDFIITSQFWYLKIIPWSINYRCQYDFWVFILC